MTDIRVNQNGAIKVGPMTISAAGIGGGRLGIGARLARTAGRMTAAWRRYRAAVRTRRALERLDDAMLRDIGLSRGYFGYEPDDGLSRRERRRITRLGKDFGLWR
jgi:uncharacterized protein YjiS (DUF1127 family)